MLGDAIANNPVVHAVGKMTGCVDPETNDLRQDSPCAKARDRLNNGEPFFTVMFDRFFQREKGEKVKFIIQLEVTAERESQINQKAIEDSCGGEILAVNPRPVPRPAVQAGSPALAKLQPTATA